MPNNPTRTQLEQARRRSELQVMLIAKQLGDIDDVALAIILKHPDKAREKLKASLAEKELGLKK